MARQKIVTALDIGTTKVCCIIAEIDKNNQLKISGFGETKSEGLSRGMIKNIRAASEATNEAVITAEKMAGVDAENIIVGVAGELIRSFVRHGMANILSKSKYTEEINEYEVTEVEIENVKNDAVKNAPITSDQKIIHIEPQYYSVDNINGILDPLGMTGHRLEADVHFVTADMGYLNSIYRSVQLLGLNVKDVVLQPIASAMAVLDDDEVELGALLIDIGGGTTDISIYYRNSLRFTCIIPFGGENITNDLSVGLRTPSAAAEKIKIDCGYAIPDNIDDNERIEVPGIGGHPSTQRSKRLIAEIINPRMQEIAQLVHNEVKKSKYLDLITSGISICGGSANLKSTNQLFSEIFNHIPTKTGYPSFREIYGSTETLSNPKYATAVGLLYWGKQNYKYDTIGKNKGPIMERLLERIKKWFETQSFT